MNRFCLDTSACSHFQRGIREVVELIDTARWVGIPSIVLGELRTGYRLGQRLRENQIWLADLLRHSLVQELVVDGEVAEIYSEIMVDLRRQGKPIPTNDVWIAATAARHGATVLTSDGPFLQIARIGCRTFEIPSSR